RGDDTIIAPSSSRRRLLGSRSSGGTASGNGGSQSPYAPSGSGGSSASVHPSFRSKSVCKLECRYCEQSICGRGMKAILLADTRVELYSTDTVPSGRVQLVGDDYMTRNCQCRIRDVACLICGNVVGYHVTQPCEVCMGACNNGHFWMFHDDAVAAIERMDSSGQSVLVWAHLPFADRDAECFDRADFICR
ncbi:Protein fam72a, partial [Rhizophlyctis rosea]